MQVRLLKTVDLCKRACSGIQGKISQESCSVFACNAKIQVPSYTYEVSFMRAGFGYHIWFKAGLIIQFTIKVHSLLLKRTACGVKLGALVRPEWLRFDEMRVS